MTIPGFSAEASCCRIGEYRLHSQDRASTYFGPAGAFLL